jgi:hypothetical protein
MNKIKTKDQKEKENKNKKMEKFKLEAIILDLKNDLNSKNEIIKIQREDIIEIKKKIKKLEKQVQFMSN